MSTVVKNTVIYPDKQIELTADEKQSIRDVLGSELFLRFMRVVATTKPSVFAVGTHTIITEQTPLASMAKLSELRGWEMHEAAMFEVLKPKAQRRKSAEPTYSVEQ